MGSSQLLELLFTQTWQVTAVIAVVWGLVKLFGKNEPYLAHTLWALVLIKCLTPPVWYSPLSAFAWLDAPPAHHAPQTTDRQGPDLAPLETEQLAGHVSLPAIRINLNTPDLSSLRPQDRNASEAIPQRTASKLPARSYWQWQQAAIGIWLVGASCCLATAFLRLRWFWRCVAASREENNAASSATIEKLTQDLASRLGLRSQVKTLVTQATVGPAVIGLWRPTIVLPVMIIERKKKIDIEPLIAHELIHIRRGDLWWAVVQTLATCLFWFHPLVWLASRMMTREAERSCDEQTIASLKCSPAVYARCLLEVLERKHQLRIAPALPGVRPMDITKNRMERIMRLGHGSRSRTPWWTAAIFLLGTVTILPGARLIRAQEEQDGIGSQNSQRADKEESITSTPEPLAGEINFKLKTYDVTDLLTEITRPFPFDLSIEEAREKLLDHLPNAQFWSDQPPYTDYQLSAGHDASGKTVMLGQSTLPARVVGNELWVFGNDDNHQQVEAALTRYREHGFEQICVSVQFLSVPVKLLEELDIQWKSANSIDPTELRPLKETCELPTPQQQRDSDAPSGRVAKPRPYEPNANSIASASYIPDARVPNAVADSASASSSPIGDTLFLETTDGDIQLAGFQAAIQESAPTKISIPETAIPTAYSVVSQAKTLEVLARAQSDLRANILQAPRVTMFNRQSGWISDVVQRPFVTGLKQVDSSDGSSKAFDPIIRVFEEGSTFRMRGALRQPDVTELLLSINMSAITRVDTFKFSDELGEDLTVQQPALMSQTMNVKAVVPNGSSIIVKAKQPQMGNGDTVLLFVASCLVLNTEFSEREEADRIDLAQKIDEKIAAEKRRQQALNEQFRTPDISISSSQPPGEKSLEELAQVLRERLGINAELLGGLEYRIDEDSIEIHGNSLSYGCEEEGFLIYGDTSTVVFKTREGNPKLQSVFQGNVTLKIDGVMEGVQATADELIVQSEEVNTNVKLNGHVQLAVRSRPTANRDHRKTEENNALDNRTIATSQLTANSIRWELNTNEFEVSGEGKYVQSIENGAPIELSAARFRWNAETNELKVIP